MGFSLYDIGGCNCVACTCYPCNLPQADLSFAYNNTLSGGGGSGPLHYSATDPFLVAPPGCYWLTPCIDVTGTAGPQFVRFYIGCVAGCAWYALLPWTTAGCTGPNGNYFSYEHPGSCASTNGWIPGVISASGLALNSSTCSPLNIVFGSGIGSPITGTITP